MPFASSAARLCFTRTSSSTRICVVLLCSTIVEQTSACRLTNEPSYRPTTSRKMAQSQSMASGTSFLCPHFDVCADCLADRHASPLLSNNPFRNRVSSESQSPGQPVQSGRPISTNPFLDATEVGTAQTTAVPSAPLVNGRMSPEKKTLSDNTTELFVRLADI